MYLNNSVEKEQSAICCNMNVFVRINPKMEMSTCLCNFYGIEKDQISDFTFETFMFESHAAAVQSIINSFQAQNNA